MKEGKEEGARGGSPYEGIKKVCRNREGMGMGTGTGRGQDGVRERMGTMAGWGQGRMG